MKKIIITFASALISVTALSQSAVTTYTIIPWQNSSSINVSTSFQSSGKQITEFPSNSLYPSYSRDSANVTWINVYTGHSVLGTNGDSINHFSYGGSSIPIKGVKRVDSIYHALMTK